MFRNLWASNPARCVNLPREKSDIHFSSVERLFMAAILLKITLLNRRLVFPGFVEDFGKRTVRDENITR